MPEIQTPKPMLSAKEAKAELVFGLVYPLGAEVDPVVEVLEDYIRHFGYKPTTIRISDWLKNVELRIEGNPETESERLIKLGNQACREARRKDFLALAAVSKISEARARGNADEPQPSYGTAHIIRSLKRPDEVHRLRQIYRPGLYVIGIFASEAERVEYLTRRKGYLEGQAKHLIEIDQAEKLDEYGQRTRKTFHLADVFVETRDGRYKDQLERFLDLVFSDPFTTPTPDEHGMFLASAASMRSAQLGRQVGAAILNEFGDVLSVGCNEVPQAGGGLYWPDAPKSSPRDKRDHKRAKDQNGNIWDSNDEVRFEIQDDILERLGPYLDTAKPLPTRDLVLVDSKLDEITEYGRAVHAEMDALLSCARNGVSPRGGILYTTTFPCHNCARHILAGGIRKVVYVEPYPKSRASELHDDALTFDENDNPVGPQWRVPFVPFVGIAPRKYMDFFSLELSTGRKIERKSDTGTLIPWSRTHDAVPRVSMLATSYLDREDMAVTGINAIMQKLEGNHDGNDEKPEEQN